MFAWLAAQHPSVATFVGTLVGSSFGLFALLIGALFNAHLNRARDDRLRGEEALSICSALTGELTGIRDAFSGVAKQAEENADDPSYSHFFVPDLAALVRVMPLLLPKFGLLAPDTVRQVINMYVTIEQFRPTLLLLGGKANSNELHVEMPQGRSGPVAEMALDIEKKIDGIIAMLNAGP